VKTFHSLPDPEEMGFSWPAFAKALERIRNVESRRREAERTAQELQERIRNETDADIQKLAQAIASGSPDPAPPGLEDLTHELREQQRLAKALEEAEPRAEGELLKVAQANREEWADEVDAALKKAIAAERRVYEKAMAPLLKARERRQHVEALSRWVRTTPPVFSPPSDATVPAAFANLGEDAGRAERQLAELQEREAEERADNERRAAS
jgi:predicted transcriptional regulator